ncbi:MULTISPECIES: hypothetical protein [Pseudomonas]|uniref:hypothetical protein n=1 Tax=Pseudomonas TaxID=286 RepID=UPI00235F413C|nr:MULTISPECIES: hypothetical protein [Pseudomonas]WJV23203.1 hypothetical protein PSR66_26795 [Pseudomonas chlororaphis]
MRKLTYAQNLQEIYSSYSPESDLWTISYEGNGDLYQHKLDFSIQPISQVMRILAKQVLNEWLKDLNYGEGKPIKSSILKISNRAILFLAVFEKLFPHKKLSELDQTSLEVCVTTAMYHSLVQNPSGDGIILKAHSRPFRKGFLTTLITAYRLFYRYHQEGRCNDGPERLVTQPVITRYLKEDLSALNLDFQDWQNANSYGSIPFVVANLLMVDAIKTLRSSRTRQLLTYFKITRETGRLDLVSKIWGSDNNKIRKFRFTSNIDHLIQPFGGDSRESVECKSLILIPLHNELQSSFGSGYRFPWPRYNDLQNDHQRVMLACYIIFLFIMGKRGGEVRPLRACDISVPRYRSNSATVTTPNFKTNDGIRSTQGVTDFIEEAFETLIGLFYTDIRDTETPLFSTLPFLNSTDKPNGKVSHSHLCRLLQDYYLEFIERATNQVEINIRQIHPQISPHQFRHSFAEFSLRRFDGNVEELLRQVFRHGANLKWIKNYSADKLDEEIGQRLNQEYIRELVPRVLRDRNTLENDFVGGMAVYINTVIRPQTLHMTPSEFEKYLDEIARDFVSVTPHEYGWCLLHKLFATQAQCSLDGITPSPRATTSKKCNGCVNFLSSRRAHFSVQRQIAITHIDFIESNVWKLPELQHGSRLAIRDAQKLFPELRDLGEL